MDNVSRTSHSGSKFRRRSLDYALYISIGFALVALAWFGSPKFLEGPGLPLVIFTPIVFGSAIRKYRNYWTVWQSWCVFSILLGVHFTLFGLLVHRIGVSNTLWILIFGYIELFAVYRLLAWAGGKFGPTNVSQKLKKPVVRKNFDPVIGGLLIY
jgi:hypothetical protein